MRELNELNLDSRRLELEQLDDFILASYLDSGIGMASD
jgi:hypothetical protein